MSFLFFLCFVALIIFICFHLFRRSIIGSISKHFSEKYGSNNFIIRYGDRTLSIDYLFGHNSESTIQIKSLKVTFDFFGYFFNKRPFLHATIGEFSLEMESQNEEISNIIFRDQFIGNTERRNSLEIVRNRQRIQKQKQSPQKLRIVHLDQETKNSSESQLKSTQSETFVYSSQNSEHSSMKSKEEPVKSQNPFDEWITRKLMAFFLANFIHSAQIDSGAISIKMGNTFISIQRFSGFYHNSSDQIITQFKLDEIDVIIHRKSENEIDSNSSESNQNMFENSENDQLKIQEAVMHIPEISLSIQSNTESLKYILTDKISQFRYNIDEINIDYSERQMVVSSINAIIAVPNDSNVSTSLTVSQLFVTFPVYDFYTKNISATLSNLSISLNGSKVSLGSIHVIRNNQPLFNSRSMKYLKGQFDFDNIDATFSMPFLIDYGLFCRYFHLFEDTDEKPIQVQNEDNQPLEDASTSTFSSTTETSIDESKFGKDRENEIVEELRMENDNDFENCMNQDDFIYDDQFSQDIDDSYYQRHAFTEDSESDFSILDKTYSSNFNEKKKRKKNSFIVNAPNAVIRFVVSDNHVLTFDTKEFSYSNRMIKSKNFTMDISFNVLQNKELNAYLKATPSFNTDGRFNQVHPFCECHHASFNFNKPTIGFKCSTGNFFFTNLFPEASFIQELLALFRFLHNQINVNQTSEDKPLTQYAFSVDIKNLKGQIKTNELASKIQLSNEAKRIALFDLQTRQEKAIQMISANLESNTHDKSFSRHNFDEASQKMMFKLYKETYEKITESHQTDDLLIFQSTDFHFSFDGPSIKNKTEGINELHKAVTFTRRKDTAYIFNNINNIAELNEQNIDDESVDLSSSVTDTLEDVFDNGEADDKEFDYVVNTMGPFDCGLITLNYNSLNISTPRIGNFVTVNNFTLSGVMLILKQQPLINNDIYHFSVTCDNKLIEFNIPRLSERTTTVFNIENCKCSEASFRYTLALNELRQDSLIGTMQFRKKKFKFRRLSFLDNFRLRYRMRFSLNIDLFNIDYNTQNDAYSTIPLFKFQLPHFQVVCNDNDIFEFNAEFLNIKILNNEQLDYSFLMTLPSPSLQLKYLLNNGFYENCIKSIKSKIRPNNISKLNHLLFTQNELLLLKCFCKQRPFFIPVESTKMADVNYDPFQLFRANSYSLHYTLEFNSKNNASLNLDYIQPLIDNFFKKKPLGGFIKPVNFFNVYLNRPVLNYFKLFVKFPSLSISLNHNQLNGKLHGEDFTMNLTKTIKERTTIKVNQIADSESNSNEIKQPNPNSNEQISGSSSINQLLVKKSNRYSIEMNSNEISLNITNEERPLFDISVSKMKIDYDEGFSVDVNLGNVNSHISTSLLNIFEIHSKMHNTKDEINPFRNINLPPIIKQTEIPDFDNEETFQSLFTKRTINVKIETMITILKFKNNTQIQSNASGIRFEQKKMPQINTQVSYNDHQMVKCAPLNSITCNSFNLLTSVNGIQLLLLEQPLFIFSNATNRKYYHFESSMLTVSPNEDDFVFFIPALRKLFDKTLSIHNNYKTISQIKFSKGLFTSVFIKKILLRLISTEMVILLTFTGNDFLFQIKRLNDGLESGRAILHKVTALNEMADDNYKTVIETQKEPLIAISYNKPPIKTTASFLQNIRIVVSLFTLRLDTSFFDQLHSEFPSVSILTLFMTENPENFLEMEDFGSTSTSTELTLQSKNNDIETDDNQIELNKKEKKKLEKKQEKEKLKQEKITRKKLAKETMSSKAIRVKNAFLCQHFTLSEIPIQISVRSYVDNSNSSIPNLAAVSASSIPMMLVNNLCVDRIISIEGFELSDFFGDYHMLLDQLSEHLKSVYIRTIGQLLKKKKNKNQQPIKND